MNHDEKERKDMAEEGPRKRKRKEKFLGKREERGRRKFRIR